MATDSAQAIYQTNDEQELGIGPRSLYSNGPCCLYWNGPRCLNWDRRLLLGEVETRKGFVEGDFVEEDFVEGGRKNQPPCFSRRAFSIAAWISFSYSASISRISRVSRFDCHQDHAIARIPIKITVAVIVGSFSLLPK